MTTISAKIVADSVFPRNGAGTRITTMQLRYPRPIHGEFMTHRDFSRNASSSRAVPVLKMIEDVERDPFIPLFWGKNQPGMQAGEDHNQLLPSENLGMITREESWREAMHQATWHARNFAEAGYHKQIVNRLLEPFAHINVVVTATEWTNFFALRNHPDAEPHIQLLAQKMLQAMEESVPTTSPTHLPYVSKTEEEGYPIEDVAKVSAARCARVSYMTHEGKEPNWDKDLELAGKLAAEPPHLSPFEHQARWIGGVNHFGQPMKYANFKDWRSQRFCMERGFNF